MPSFVSMSGLSALRFDIWEVLLLFGIFQAVFLSVVILWSPRPKRTEHFLVILLAILALNLMNFLFLEAGFFRAVPHLVHVSIPPLLLLGPIYYFYARSLILDAKMSAKDGWHLVLFVLGLIYFLPFYLLAPSQKLTLMDPLPARAAMPVAFSMVAFFSIQILQSLYYTLRVYRLISLVPDVPTKANHRDKKRWLQAFNVGFASFWVADLLCLWWLAGTSELRPGSFYLVMFLSVGFISVLAFFGMRWNKYFVNVILNHGTASYRSAPLSNDQKAGLVRLLEDTMAKRELYLDPHLSLEQLASQMNVPKHHLSQVLNVMMGKSFYEFVNEYRFKEVKRRLARPDLRHLTILAIAFESGFNNKNTFNKVFKKHAGMTPSQYLRMISTNEKKENWPPGVDSQL